MQEPSSTGLSRRSFLGAAGVAALGVPLAAGTIGSSLGAFGLGRVPGASAAGTTLPVSIVNNSGSYANSNVYVSVVGTDLTTNAQGHVDPSGTFHPASPGEDGSAWNTLLSDAGTVNLPADGMSGRIYLSFGGPVPWSVVGTAGGAGIVQPAPWVSSDASYDLLHDFFEFTWQNGAMYCNSTQVDMLSVPIGINLVGAQNQTVGVVQSGGRETFFNQMRNTDGFSDLVVNDLRVIAPSHGIDSGLFSSTYLDGYIADAWNAYTGKDLTVTANNQTYTLRTSGSTMTATQNGNQVASFQLPSTSNVLYCNGNLAAPNDGVTGPIAAVLGAALNRTTLRDYASQPTTDPSTFYQQPQTNFYAAGLHQIHTDGKSYGFAFDDVGSFASYIQDSAATACTLTIEPLS
jgi:hypothetical protein